MTKARQSKSVKPSASRKRKPGSLIIIGGRENKGRDPRILTEIARRAKPKGLVVASVASEIPQEVWKEYDRIFRGLGVKRVEHLDIERPEQARIDPDLHLFDKLDTVFFTGGDQLKITTKLGGTAIVDRIVEIFEHGGTIAGTSAGAAVMGEMMLVGGVDSHKIGNWMMAPGLGFMKNVFIDQHFAQRGRMGRLLGAVAQNPGVLGIGIDEDTAILVNEKEFQVMGSNAVYIVDGRSVTYTNIAESAPEKTMSMYDVRVHILSDGDRFDFKTRRPSHPDGN